MTNLPCNVVRFVSYNSRGLNVNKQSYLCSVLADCDILLLQEHWLREEQLNCLTTLSTDHMSVAVSGFENDRVLSDRPYGGCAKLWRKALFLTAQSSLIAVEFVLRCLTAMVSVSYVFVFTCHLIRILTVLMSSSVNYLLSIQWSHNIQTLMLS